MSDHEQHVIRRIRRIDLPFRQDIHPGYVHQVLVQEILMDQPAEKGNDKPRNLSELLPENGSQVNGKGILGALHG